MIMGGCQVPGCNSHLFSSFFENLDLPGSRERFKIVTFPEIQCDRIFQSGTD